MDDEEIIIPEGTVFKRKYTYQPYTYHRIVKVLKDNQLYLEPIIWYKCGRYSGYRQKYNIKEIGTGKILRAKVSLDDIREIFAELDIPLKEVQKPQRNQQAVAFLETMERLKKNNTV